MDVKQEPLVDNEGITKIELVVISGEPEENALSRNPQPLKNEYICQNINIFESQSTGSEIKQEIIKFEEPKTGHLNCPTKNDSDWVGENIQIYPISIKKELLEDTSNVREVNAMDMFVDISDNNREVSAFVQPKVKDEVLTTHCDLQTLKNESNEYLNYFVQPCSSKQTKRKKILKTLQNTQKYVSRKKRKNMATVCQKNSPYSKSRLSHNDGFFKKRSIFCSFCGKFFIKKFEFLFHYFIHSVRNNKKKVTKIDKEETKNETDYMEPDVMKVKRSKYHSKVNRKLYKCHICNKKCMLKNSLQLHLIIHTKEKPFKRDISSNKINQKSYLQKHQSNKNIFKCDSCSKIFNKRSAFQKHLIVHTNQKPFQCKICHKRCNLKSNLQKHLIIHTNEKPFKCEICLKQFNLKCNLQKHLIIHSDIKPFKCDICSKEFNLKANLKKHLITHTNEKLYKCDICSKEFHHKNYLKLHLRVHTNEKPFECDICYKKFKHKDALQKHLIIHTDEKLFECDICSKQFYTKSNLQKHLIIHTDEKPYKCHICSKELRYKFSYQQHLVIHGNEKPFECEICFKKFNQKSALRNHSLVHTNEKPYNCDICFKTFKQKNSVTKHLIIHTNERPFNCDICSKKFNKKDTLKRHLTVHNK